MFWSLGGGSFVWKKVVCPRLLYKIEIATARCRNKSIKDALKSDLSTIDFDKQTKD